MTYSSCTTVLGGSADSQPAQQLRLSTDARRRLSRVAVVRVVVSVQKKLLISFSFVAPGPHWHWHWYPGPHSAAVRCHPGPQ
jgi:hypothetical protein